MMMKGSALMGFGFARQKIFLIGTLLAFAAGLVLVLPVSAQQPTPSDNQVNTVAHELYCPVCENIPLDVCPTQACAQWRDLIRQKLAAGWSKQQIENYFAAQYGERVLAVPPMQRSFNQLLPGLIAAGILSALGLVAWVLRGSLKVGRRARPVEDTPPGKLPGVDEEYLRRIEEDLRRRA
jgi:cytochrome c-type biogenesis protein CcmH